MCASVVLRTVLAALTRQLMRRAALAVIVDFLEHNAKRADLDCDRRRGRLSVGLDLCEAAYVITQQAVLVTRLRGSWRNPASKSAAKSIACAA